MSPLRATGRRPQADHRRSRAATPADVVFFDAVQPPCRPGRRRGRRPARARGAATVIVDNIFAALVVPATRLRRRRGRLLGHQHPVDGQGQGAGGAILGTDEYIRVRVDPHPQHRSIAVGVQRVSVSGPGDAALHVRHQTASALQVATSIEQQPSVSLRPLPVPRASHPQHRRALAQQSGGGTIVTFNLAVPDGATPTSPGAAFGVLDALHVVDISNNLGDAESLIARPATTTTSGPGPRGGRDRDGRSSACGFSVARGHGGPDRRPHQGPGDAHGLKVHGLVLRHHHSARR